MTRRTSTIRRRVSARESLDVFVEVAAAGALWSWVIDDQWRTRRFWAAIGAAHGARIDAKVREACPGCRPGYRYALGEFPPIPLVTALPANHLDQCEHIEVDGTRHWFVGPPWQRCQAEHLRELGEIDGAEWQRYVAWRDAGFPARYVPDESPDGSPMGLTHLCY